MDSEISIPTGLVPPEILQKLKEIGRLLQSESVPSRFSSSTTSKGQSGVSKKEADECDDLEGSGVVVHVLGADRGAETKKDSDVVSLFDQNKDCSVVSVFEPKTEGDAVSAYDQRKDTDTSGVHDRRSVVSLSGGTRLVETTQAKENEAVYENRSSPHKDFMNQNPRSFRPHSQPHASSVRTAPPACSQSSQQYSTKSSYPNPHEVPEHYTLHSQQHHRSSPFQPLSGGLEVEEERCVVVCSRSPCKTPKRCEDTARQHRGSFVHRSDSPSMSEASSSSGTITATTSSSSQSFRSRSSPSLSCSNDDDLLRGIPARSVMPSGDVGQKSPKVLTPPETPENDSKRVVPEVFTFDDLTCTEERLRQSWERLRKLHDQFTPTKRSPSTPRNHPPSTPPTPSYRRQEPVLPSTPVRRISPVDSHFLQRMEAAAVSPQPKLKTSSDLPGSPAPPSTPQRMSAAEAEYSSPQHQRRDSVSPKPRKRLSFDEDGGSSHQMLQAQQQRLRTYDSPATAAAYHLLSPRPSGSGSDNPFSFTPYSMEGQQQLFGRGTPPGKSALSFAEFQKKMASLADFHEGRESEGDYDDDKRGGPFFSGTRHVYESIEFQNRLAMQNGRYTPKRKRSEHFDDGSDGIALCTCAVMERNFLQMAECAYKRIRRTDATPADFDRFRNELAQTNEILRESMGLMKHIRDLCDHRKRPRW